MSDDNDGIVLYEQDGKVKRLIYIDIDRLECSPFNPRGRFYYTVSGKGVEGLANRIVRLGFDIMRAPWAHEQDGQYYVFAGWKRCLSARKAGLSKLPVLVHDGFTCLEIERLSRIDNTNNEYYSEVFADRRTIAMEVGIYLSPAHQVEINYIKEAILDWVMRLSYLAGMRHGFAEKENKDKHAYYTVYPCGPYKISLHETCSYGVHRIYIISKDARVPGYKFNEVKISKRGNVLNLLIIKEAYDYAYKLLNDMPFFSVTKEVHIEKCQRCGTLAYTKEHNNLMLCEKCIEEYQQNSQWSEVNIDGVVYIIEAINMGLYKIGHTNDIDIRKQALVKLPFDILVYHVIESNDRQRLERELHDRFSHKRVNGEWFELSEDDLAELKQEATVFYD